MVKTSTSDRLPLSPTRSPDAGFVWWQSVLFAVALVGAIIVGSAVGIAVLAIVGPLNVNDFKTMTVPAVFVTLTGYAAALAVMAPLLPGLAQRSWRALGWRGLRARDVVYAIAGAAVMVFVTVATGAAQEALFHLKADEVQVQMLRDARGAAVANFVVIACAVAPFFEELVFRGFIFNALRRYMPVWVAVILSAGVFGLSHLQHGNAGAIVPLAASGVVLALVYYRTGSLFASMITHALFNTVTVVLVLVYHQT